MTKTELIEAVAQATEMSKKDAGAAVEATFAAMTAALKKGDKVSMIGFGSFEVKERAARTGKNPQTGAAIKIPASKAVAFKCGKGMKDIVNG